MRGADYKSDDWRAKGFIGLILFQDCDVRYKIIPGHSACLPESTAAQQCGKYKVIL